MTTILYYLRFFLATLSLAGYAQFFHKKCHINRCASPLFALSVITLITYLLGLVGLLKYSAYVLCIVGLLLLIEEGYHRTRKEILNPNVFNGHNLLMLFVFLFVSHALLNMNLIHYDNFSHWGIVAKEMLLTDAFPTKASLLIEFKNYPLAATSWIYYMSKIIGGQEGGMLAAQFILIFSCFEAMFCAIRDRKRFLLEGILWVTFGVMLLFNVSIRMDNLLVDFVLPMMALAVIGIACANGEDMKKTCITAAPILAMMVLVKNNGLFFFAICVLFLLFKAGKSQKKLQSFVVLVLCAAFATGFYLTWHVHTTLEFGDEPHKFQVTADGPSAEAAKTEEEKQLVIHEFQAQVLTIKNMDTVGFVAVNVLTLAAWLVGKIITKKKWRLLRVLMLADAMYLVYYAGILLMYLFLMPMEEAAYLAGFERYTSSIFILFLGMIGLTLLRDVEDSFYIQQGEERDIYAFHTLQSKSIYMNTCLALAIAGTLLMISEINGMKYLHQDYDTTLPGEVRIALTGYQNTDSEASYALYATDRDAQVSNYYLGYVARYHLRTTNLYVFSDFNDPEIAEHLKNYDYLVLVEVDEAARSVLQDVLTEEIKPGVYPIKGKELPIHLTQP